MRLGLKCSRCEAITELRLGEDLPPSCEAGCGGSWDFCIRWPALVEFTGPAEFKSIGVIPTSRDNLKRLLFEARERYRRQPSTENTEECERLYLELCQMEAEEEDRQRER